MFNARECVFERAADGTPIKTLGIANDITALRKAEQAVRDKTVLLEAVLDNAGEGIIAADANGKVTLINRTATQLFDRSDFNADPTLRRQKYTVLELDNKTVIPPDQTPLARTLRGLTVENHEMIVRGTDEVNRYFLTTGRPLVGDDGTSRGGVVTFRDVTMIKEAQNALAALAVTDDLTQLPNKRALRERLDQLAREGNRGRKFAVVVSDVDHFKKVNDTHGHKTGDEVLTAVARALRSNIRSTDFVGRYGGEEFVVLFTDVDESIAKGLADKLRLAIAGLERPVKITASFGVCANFGPLANDAEGLMKAADEALYRAKHAGRNRVVAHHQPVAMDR
jgi:diguanylate cyclase (GGDEF)-like protein